MTCQLRNPPLTISVLAHPVLEPVQPGHAVFVPVRESHGGHADYDDEQRQTLRHRLVPPRARRNAQYSLLRGRFPQKRLGVIELLISSTEDGDILRDAPWRVELGSSGCFGGLEQFLSRSCLCQRRSASWDIGSARPWALLAASPPLDGSMPRARREFSRGLRSPCLYGVVVGPARGKKEASDEGNRGDRS